MELVFLKNDRIITDSLIVAETFKKLHKNILRDIRNLECSQEFARLNFEHTFYTAQNGQQYEKFYITQDGFSFLVMGYTGKEAARFKEMYINEFNRMKNQISSTYSLPQNYKEALLALVYEVEHREKLEHQLEEQKPKVALYDTAMSAKNNQTMGQVAKELNIGRNKLFILLRQEKILMKNNLPYQTYMDRGYFEVRMYTITHMTQGLENKSQTMITPKGIDWIKKIIQKLAMTS